MQDSGHTSAWAGQTVERTRSNGKRVFATAFKLWIVEEARRPGASVAGLAMRYGINANQLHRWVRLPHLRGEAPASLPAPVLLPVIVEAGQPCAASTSTTAAAPVPIEIELGGAVVRVPVGVDAATLRTVLAALRR
jgi:transposase-like protein